MTLSEAVKEIRRKRGYTQKGLAKDLGISQARLSRIERGEGRMSMDEIDVLFKQMMMYVWVIPQDDAHVIMISGK